jgi:hypothetical protein
VGRERDAARLRSSCATTTPSRSPSTRSTTTATRSSSTRIRSARRADFTHTNEGNANPDWNPIWDVRTGRFEGGWTVEMQHPVQVARGIARAIPGLGACSSGARIRRKNEWVHLTQISRSRCRRQRRRGDHARVAARDARGLEVPPASREPRDQAVRDLRLRDGSDRGRRPVERRRTPTPGST